MSAWSGSGYEGCASYARTAGRGTCGSAQQQAAIAKAMLLASRVRRSDTRCVQVANCQLGKFRTNASTNRDDSLAKDVELSKESLKCSLHDQTCDSSYPKQKLKYSILRYSYGDSNFLRGLPRLESLARKYLTSSTPVQS